MRESGAPILVATFVVIGALNLFTLALFRIDKSRADRPRTKAGARRRIPESRLLLLAALGGTPGAYAARHVFRHKSRKQPFSARLHAIAATQLAALTALTIWWATA